MDKAVHTWTKQYTYVQSSTHIYEAVTHMDKAVYTWIKLEKAIHTWTKLYTHGQSCT